MLEKEIIYKTNVYRREIRLDERCLPIESSRTGVHWVEANNILNFSFFMYPKTETTVRFELSGDILKELIQFPEIYQEKHDFPYKFGGQFKLGPHLGDHVDNHLFIQYFSVLKIFKTKSDYIFEESDHLTLRDKSFYRRISVNGIQESYEGRVFQPDKSAVYQTQLIPFARSLEKNIEKIFNIFDFNEWRKVSNGDFKINDYFDKSNLNEIIDQEQYLLWEEI